MSLEIKDSSVGGLSVRVSATTSPSHQLRVVVHLLQFDLIGQLLKRWIILGLPNCLCRMSSRVKICKLLTQIIGIRKTVTASSKEEAKQHVSVNTNLYHGLIMPLGLG